MSADDPRDDAQERATFEMPSRCGAGRGCDCPRCSYVDGYEDARAEAMGMQLGTIDTIRSMRPPRRTPTSRALRQLADALDNLAAEAFGPDCWREFERAVRKHVQERSH